MTTGRINQVNIFRLKIESIEKETISNK